MAALLTLQGEACDGGQPSIKKDVENPPRIKKKKMHYACPAICECVAKTLIQK